MQPPCAAGEYVPGRQLVQAVALGSAKEPALQEVHAVRPCAAEKLPARQEVQPGASAPLEDVPAPHGVHVEAPGTDV